MGLFYYGIKLDAVLKLPDPPIILALPSIIFIARDAVYAENLPGAGGRIAKMLQTISN